MARDRWSVVWSVVSTPPAAMFKREGFVDDGDLGGVLFDVILSTDDHVVYADICFGCCVSEDCLGQWLLMGSLVFEESELYCKRTVSHRYDWLTNS